EKITVPRIKPNITLLGQGMERTAIVWNDTANSSHGTFYSASVSVFASNFIATNISFMNVAPIANPGDVGGQAVAFRIAAGDANLWWKMPANDTSRLKPGWFEKLFKKVLLDKLDGRLYEEVCISDVGYTNHDRKGPIIHFVSGLQDLPQDKLKRNATAWEGSIDSIWLVGGVIGQTINLVLTRKRRGDLATYTSIIGTGRPLVRLVEDYPLEATSERSSSNRPRHAPRHIVAAQGSNHVWKGEGPNHVWMSKGHRSSSEIDQSVK
ncbi:hypothetical protein AMTR_s00116p00020830, partial [Amborella trichopoda]